MDWSLFYWSLLTFFRKKSIRRHKTVADTPQQNGLTERTNKTILERVKCMLLGDGLPNYFWGEVTTLLSTLQIRVNNLF